MNEMTRKKFFEKIVDNQNRGENSKNHFLQVSYLRL